MQATADPLSEQPVPYADNERICADQGYHGDKRHPHQAHDQPLICLTPALSGARSASAQARCSAPTHVTSPRLATGSAASNWGMSSRRSATRFDGARSAITAMEKRDRAC